MLYILFYNTEFVRFEMTLAQYQMECRCMKRESAGFYDKNKKNE